MFISQALLIGLCFCFALESFGSTQHFKNTAQNEIDIDPCITDPCANQHHTICQKIENRGMGEERYQCLNEKYLQLAMLRLKFKADPCLNNPCHHSQICKKNEFGGYKCENQTTARILLTDSDNQQVELDIPKIEFCQEGARLPHPNNPKKFIACHANNHHTIMTCPKHTVFNRFLDRCDYNQDPPNQGCFSSPCKFGGKCVDLGNWLHECDCPSGYSGENCEITPNYCELDMCGNNGVCFPMTPSSPVPYYCLCGDNAGYGSSCGKNMEANPCKPNELEEVVYPTKISSAIYVQCDEESFHLRFCNAPLVFSNVTNQCEWLVDSVIKNKVRSMI